MKNKKGLIIFDLDGVLINSEQNMSYAWSQTCKKLKLKISFNKYKKYVGLGFLIQAGNHFVPFVRASGRGEAKLRG